MRSEQFLRVADLRLWLEKPSSGVRVIGADNAAGCSSQENPHHATTVILPWPQSSAINKIRAPDMSRGVPTDVIKRNTTTTEGGEGQGAAIEFPVTANILSRCASSNCFAFIFRLQNTSAKSNEVTFPPLYCVFEAAPRTGVLSVDKKKKKNDIMHLQM